MRSGSKFVSLFLILVLATVCLAACGNGDGDDGNAGDDSNDSSGSGKPASSSSNSLDKDWGDIPIYEGAKKAGTEEGPSQWGECEESELRLWTTGDSPEDVCMFYKDAMNPAGWLTLTYQWFPEGACAATYITDLGNDSSGRILLGVGHVARNEDEVEISLLFGKGCP